MRIFQTKKKLKNYTKQLLENIKNEEYTQLLWKMFAVLILPIGN